MPYVLKQNKIGNVSVKQNKMSRESKSDALCPKSNALCLKSIESKDNAQCLLRKSSLKFCMYTTFVQGQEMTLTFNTHIPSYTQLDVCSH